MRILTILGFCLLFHCMDIDIFAAIIRVPGDVSMIQSGIDAADDGDTVLVYPGEYKEHINFNGKNITVGSLFLTTGDATYINSTIISPYQSRPVTFEHGEDSTACLSGFTLSDGMDIGGGILCWNSSPILNHLIIENNTAWEWGGGIYCVYHANPTIRDVIIRNNHCNERGGGIACWAGSSPLIEDTIIKNNTAYSEGGGISLMSDCYPRLRNVSVINNSAYLGGGIAANSISNFIVENLLLSGNHAEGFGGAIFITSTAPGYLNNLTIVGNTASIGGSILHSDGSGRVSFVNTIFWQNDTPLFTSDANYTCLIGYSDFKNMTTPIDTISIPNFIYLEGNIDADPQFVNPTEHKYDLSPNSPCVDTGTPLLIWNGDTLINLAETEYQGNAPDMGGKESPFTVDISAEQTLPNIFRLHQNYPNPFNSNTAITYELPKRTEITLMVYNVAGQVVRVLTKGERSTGSHVIRWDGTDSQGQAVSTGLYFIQLKRSGQVHVIKIMLIK